MKALNLQILAFAITTLAAAMMFLLVQATRKSLRRSLPLDGPEESRPVVKPGLLNPLQEILLGMLFTVSTPFFALWCVMGTGRIKAALAVALLTAALTSYGTFVRRRDALDSLGGAVREAPRIRRQLACFSVALFLFLTGLVVAAATLARHFGATAPAA